MKRAAKFLIVLTVGCFFLIGVGFLAFYHLVQVGEFRAFLVREIERETDFRVQLGEGELEIGRILGVGFRAVSFTDPTGDQPAITAERVTARVAFLPLLRRRVIVREFRLERPTVRLSRDTQGKFPLLDRMLNLPFLKRDQGQFSFDLRRIKVAGGEMQFQDSYGESEPVTTLLHNVNLDLERLRGAVLREFVKKLARKQVIPENGALDFALTTTLERDGQKAKVNSTGTMIFPEEKLEFAKARWMVQARLSEASGALMQSLWHGRLPAKTVSGTLDSRLQLEGEPDRHWQVTGEVKFSGFRLVAPELFVDPLDAGSGQMNFSVEWRPSQWSFPRVELTTVDLSLKARGALRALPDGQMQIQLSALAPAVRVDTFRKYLPLKWLASPTLDGALAATSEGEVNIKDFGVAVNIGPRRRLIWESLNDRVRFDAELRNLSGKFSGGYLPFRGVQGRVAVENGLLWFKNFKGSYGQTSFETLEGSYRPQGAAVSVRAHGELELGEAREQLKLAGAPPAATNFLQSINDLGGPAKFDLSLTRSATAPLSFEGKLGFDGARLRIERYGFADIKGDLNFNRDEINADKASASLNGSPVQIRLAVRNYAAENGGFDLRVESNAVKTGVITTLLQEKASLADPGTVRGWVRYQGPLVGRPGRRLSGQLDLTNVQFHLQPLLQPLRELNGTIQFDEAGIDFQNIKGLLLGVPASVNGRWRFGQKTPLFFDFAAPDLDLQYLLSQIDPEGANLYNNLEAVGKVALARCRYKSFEFTDLKTEVVLDHRVWRLSRLASNAGGGTLQGVATINHLRDTIEFSAEPKMQSVPVANFIGWFDGGKTDMTGRVNIVGRLNSFGKDGTERLHNLSGNFNLRIEDGTIRRMRVVVQILNFLDLSRWFTFQVPDLTKRGINFRSITADFKVERGVYHTDNLIVDSDDLRMSGSGKIDSPKDEIDFVLAVRPFAGMDTGLNQIPLIGTGIAAIKNSFLVASFNVKGPMDDPTITPAPLSTLSEMALGVLRIPKRILTLPAAEKKEGAP